MAIKRIVPKPADSLPSTYGFADGVRQLPSWEQNYLDDAVCRELTKSSTHPDGKRLIELTYQEWLEQVWSVMQVRNQFVSAVVGQRKAHFLEGRS